MKIELNERERFLLRTALLNLIDLFEKDSSANEFSYQNCIKDLKEILYKFM